MRLPGAVRMAADVMEVLTFITLVACALMAAGLVVLLLAAARSRRQEHDDQPWRRRETGGMERHLPISEPPSTKDTDV